MEWWRDEMKEQYPCMGTKGGDGRVWTWLTTLMPHRKAYWCTEPLKGCSSMLKTGK